MISNVTNYISNFQQLSSSDNAYVYDENGNLESDANKGIGNITYNYLNLPEKVEFEPKKYIAYKYSASGQKLSKTVIDSTKTPEIVKVTTYSNGFVYTDNELDYFGTEAGKVVAASDGTYDYQYFLKDHLGSVRAVFHKGTDGNVEVLQEQHYYPFGMSIGDLAYTNTTNQYGFGGKELTQFSELDYYDFHARNYDAQLGRWNSPDILMEMYSNESPYSYAGNNPVNNIDPNGMSYYSSMCENSGGGGFWYRGEFVSSCGGGSGGEKKPSQRLAEQRDSFNAWVDANIAQADMLQELINLYDGDVVTDLTAFGRIWNPYQSLRYTFKDGTVLFVELGDNVSNMSGSVDQAQGGNEGYFPDALYSHDANKGDVYVSDKEVINVFGQSCQPASGTVTMWGIAIYELLAGSKSILPRGATAPILMLQINLQLEDWRRNAILLDYNNNGGGQGMIMNYRESIQDLNGYLHVARSITLIDAVNGRNYGNYNQNYLPRK